LVDLFHLTDVRGIYLRYLSMIKQYDKVYVAGPMSGLPNHNYEAFHAMERKIIERFPGTLIFNPARNFNGYAGLPWEVYMREDIPNLCRCTAIVFLDQWWRSKGARLEMEIAVKLGMKMYNHHFQEIIP
jgi:hypothetical protein